MDDLLIRGGVPLRGAVTAAGSKNAALPIMAAALLAEERVRLERVPQLCDVATLGQVLGELGMSVRRERDDCLLLETINSRCISTSARHVQRMRASFCVLGPLLAKRGRGVVALPGGCNLGPRPIDLHLRGLAALGATIYIAGGYVEAHARRLTGARISMRGPFGPTVTGTMNVMSAAVLAEGTTVIEHAAREPEVVALGAFLNALGGQIRGLGTHEITIEGVDALRGTEYTLGPDRIETATWLCAAAITGGSITVRQTVPAELDAVLTALQTMGVALDIRSDEITATGPERLTCGTFCAEPYPALPTDVQPLLTALAVLAEGKTTLQDTVFPQRSTHHAPLRKLGAHITSSGGRTEIEGVSSLTPCCIAAADLRGAAALVLAALATPGETRIRNAEHLDRGYEQFVARLAALGADVRRSENGAPRTPATQAAV